MPEPDVMLPSLTRDRLFAVLAIAAVAVRIAFWAYTQRVWEDAYITLTPVRTLFAGHGLTHHSSEPAIHSFTSVISIAIPIVGKLFGAPLLSLRLTALVATVATFVFAREIARDFDMSRAAAFLFGGYLAFDQLQVFFGITGMETQVAVATALAVVVALRRRNIVLLGVACGVAILVRPDFALFAAVIVALEFLRRRWRDGFVVAGVSAAVIAPWVAFATWYYGTPVPHTITAKNLYAGIGLNVPTFDQLYGYARETWRVVSPFWQHSLVTDAPFPIEVAQLFAVAIFALGLVGLWTRRRDETVLVIGAVLTLFFAYRTGTRLPRYFMWYLPPFIALAFILVALGFDRARAALRRPHAAVVAVAAVVVALYALPTLLDAPIERTIQAKIEYGVRKPVGEYLRANMQPGDRVVLEPVGYIGYFAGDVTTVDFPGLTSEIATTAMHRIPKSRRSPAALAAQVEPEWAVLRPGEFTEFKTLTPEVARRYEVAKRFSARPRPSLEFLGLRLLPSDEEFVVLRRTR